MLSRQEPTRFSESDACVHLRLGQSGQLGAEVADEGPRRPYKNPMPGDPFTRAQVDDGQPYLDDLADRPVRRCAVPACRFDIDDVQQLLDSVHMIEGRKRFTH